MVLLYLSSSVFILIITINIPTVKSDAFSSTKLKLVIDTDAGSDDAMALFMLLRAAHNPKTNNNLNGPDILGITCASGNTGVNNVVINVLKVLQIEDRLDIPVYRGAESSLLWTPQGDNHFGSDGMGDVPMSNPPSLNQVQPEHAVNALIRLVNEYPGQITILSIAPLTNIALAIRMYPNFLMKIKKLIIVGGSIKGFGNMIPGVEFNFYMDAEANYIVLNGTQFCKNSILLMPWETVLDLSVFMDWRKYALGQLKSKEILFMNEVEHIDTVKYEQNEIWKVADIIGAAITLNESLIGHIRSYRVAVILEGPTRGGIAVDYTDLLKSGEKIDMTFDIDLHGYQQDLLHNFS